MFNLHTHRYTATPKCTELVNHYPWDFDPKPPIYSMGIHPWYIDPVQWQLHLEIVVQHVMDSDCWAVGECGLDKRIAIPFDLQCEVFKAHLKVAEKHQKPVILHLVGAFQELITIKQNMAISVPLIVHGFSKNSQLAHDLVKQGFYLSFGKYLLRNPELKATFLAVPDDRVFLETDTIEESLVEVYTRAAQYRNQSISELELQIQKNVESVFGRCYSK